MHATQFLKDPAAHATGPMVVLFGPQRYLRQEALGAICRLVLTGDDAEAGPTRVAGKDAEWKTVSDELLTVSMWGDRRLVVVEDADDFVTKNRAALEKYLDRPAKKSVLALTLKSFPGNTRLAKAVAKVGLALECAELKGIQLQRWLGETASERHGKHLTREAAALMESLAGSELALLDQELAKLAAYVGERRRIEAEDVSKLVGGWKAETTWVMLDALQDGNLAAALACLDKLLTAGEAPQKILGGIVYAYRALAEATELTRLGMPLPAALKQAGVFPSRVDAAARYLRRIGRPRAERFHALLLHADGGMKGQSRVSERVLLESLLVQLSGAA